MTTQPTQAPMKEIIIRTIRALDEQNTASDLHPHVDDGSCTEAEAWRILNGEQYWQRIAQLQQLIDKYGLYRGA